jgi:hypothetical protein
MRHVRIVLGACLACFGGMPACAPSPPESPPVLVGTWTCSQPAHQGGTQESELTLNADGSYVAESWTLRPSDGPGPVPRTPITGIWSQRGTILTTTGQTRWGRPIPDSDLARVVRLVYRDGCLWPLLSDDAPKVFLRRK